ncbi:DUF4097 family beta strand repeat-containing protein [Rubrivirga sp. IMCC45206]|uniref:DUF4097 family beta strand repeat-containing protein n=1 Tax=Rubrivirga sp. IMCC45206 TaxID=3391614 RepID=UPI00398FAC5E
MSRTRKPLQRALLALLGALLLVVGVRAFASTADVRVERLHDGAAHQVTIDLVSATVVKDVLFDESFDVRSGGRLLVDLGSENVTVRTVSGTRARVVVEGRGRDAASEFERRRFSARVRSGDLTVRTDPPRRRWSTGRRDASFQVTVEVPRRYSATVDLGSGNVQVASIEGDLSVDVGSGNVDVADVTGRRVMLDTGSGNVRARSLRGEVRIDTGSGSVEVDRVEGSLWVDTGSGSVSVGSVDGPAEVDTGSGRVELTLRSARAATVDTGSGSITVRVPRGAGFDLDAEGGSLRIDDGLGFSGERERDEARGRLGRGGPDLRLSAGSGAVRVVQA